MGKSQVLNWIREQPYEWSRTFVPGSSVFDCRVRVGDTYHPQFQKRIPPFYDLAALPHDRPMTAEEQEKSIQKRLFLVIAVFLKVSASGEPELIEAENDRH